MMKQKSTVIHLSHILIVLWIPGIFGVAGCSNTDGIAADDTANLLKAVEIRQYEGSNLSLVNDFRENSIRGPQLIDRKTYRLKITGLAAKPETYTYDEVIGKYRHYNKKVTLNCVEGWNVTILWEGVLVRDLIKEVRPSSQAKVVIFHAYDGYTTSFPIRYIMDNNIILAYRMNGVVIPPERGFPFQLVAESKWGYKWIKWITEIELSDDIRYKGYWERRGYSNSGDLNKSFFDDTAQ
jgi:DMSO/TMAO reductase YedYZ molybdopterin-dependent catalytic subunit